MRNSIRDKIKSTDFPDKIEGIDWLVKKRLGLNLSQEAVAKEIGISPITYYAIEKGRYTPSIRTAKKLAKFFKCDWKNFYD